MFTPFISLPTAAYFRCVKACHVLHSCYQLIPYTETCSEQGTYKEDCEELHLTVSQPEKAYNPGRESMVVDTVP